MSISSTDRIAGPFTSGTVLPFSFVVFVPADVRVVKTSADGEILPDLVSPADYSVTVNPDQNVSPGGQVTLTSAITGGASVVVTSRLKNTQPVTITNLGAFLPETLNKAFDRQCILTQQVATKVEASLQFPVSDANAQTPVLPPASVRANQAIIFDGNGNVGVGAVASASVSVAMQPVVAAGTLAAARTALGASTVGDSLFTAANAAAARAAIGAGAGNGDMLAATYDPANIAQQLVGTTATQTLTNKTLTTPTLTRPVIVGRTDGGNASAGNVGEYVSSTVLSGAAVSLTTGTAINITSISLTAGDWDVGGVIQMVAGGAASTFCAGWTNSAATEPVGPNSGGYAGLFAGQALTNGLVMVVGTRRYSLSATTTIYLGVRSNFTGTEQAYGFIGARRVQS